MSQRFYTKGKGRKRKVIPLNSSKSGRRVASVLGRDVKEEKSDHKKYLEQARELDAVGRHEDAEKLEKIAAQEKKHSEIEQEIIKHPDAVDKWAQTATSEDEKVRHQAQFALNINEPKPITHKEYEYDLEKEVNERHEENVMKSLKEQYKRPEGSGKRHENKRGVVTFTKKPLNSNQKRALKGKLMNHYEEKGRHDISSTDSTNIILFSDSPINSNSRKVFDSKHGCYSTHFSEKEANNIIGAGN